MTFSPGPSLITDITRAIPPVVTTDSDHNLSTGEVIRLIVPKDYGMTQLNNTTCIITRLSDTTFSCQSSLIPSSVDLDTRSYTAFINAGTGTPAQVIPIGSGPSQSSLPTLYSSPLVGESTLNDTVLNIATVNQPF